MWQAYTRALLSAPEPAARGWELQPQPDELVVAADGRRMVQWPVAPPLDGRKRVGFLLQERAEAFATVLMDAAIPHMVPIRGVSPRILYDEPPSLERPAHMTVREATACLFQLCETLAHAHACGWTGLQAGREHIRIGSDGIAVVLPHLHIDGGHVYVESDVLADIATAISFAADLLAGGRATVCRRRWWMGNRTTGAPESPEHAELLEHLGENAPVSAAELAQRLAPLVPVEWARRVDRLPHVTDICPPPMRWDRIVDLGEQALAQTDSPYLRQPLGSALHQRAVIAWKQSDLSAALRDLDRSIEVDPWARALTTRALVHEALGHAAQAESDEHAAIAAADADWIGRRDQPADVARARYVRAIRRFRRGDITAAREDLVVAQEAAASVKAWVRIPRSLVERIEAALARVRQFEEG